jgi:Protein of unknown function (DUF1553)/Protein of unknown function (DUF1549)/Planctomycete cytochrome C
MMPDSTARLRAGYHVRRVHFTMKAPFTIACLVVSCVCLVTRAAPEVAPSKEGLEFFEKHIRPVLVERCYKCHSEGEKVKGKLRLDSREGVLKGGESGSAAVVPGEPEKSVLIQAIRYSHEDLQMPPKEPLSKAEVAAFEQWVKMGAPDPRVSGGEIATTQASAKYDFAKWREFWAFKPVQKRSAPSVKDPLWCANEVDAFVLAKMEEKGIKPVGDAGRRVLIRRLTYDLTGLPPAPEEVEQFVNDPSPSAYERVVDRLLSSSAYGEKWGRMWLDVVRYADTSGCNSDFPVPDLWRYRNWVISAFNADKPYDQFLREQIAGDLLPGADVKDRNEKIVATGYIAGARRFGSRNAEFHLTIEDTIDNMGKAMLGLSVSCARCHDHKYDPIPNADYYALYGIFNSTKYAFPGTEIYKHTKDFIALGGDAEQEKLAAWEGKLAELDDRYEIVLREKDRLESAEKRAKELAGKGEAVAVKDVAKPQADNKEAVTKEGAPEPTTRTSAEAKAELFEIRGQIQRLENTPVEVEKAYAVSEGAGADAKVQIKGDPKALGAAVRRGFLTMLGGQKLPESEKGSGRKQLAQWVASPSNPLTARVMVNRIWQGHFGKGIVQTPNDFGSRGQRPTHPELLDYLAAKFVEGGWSVKRMHKLMVMSHAYRLASVDDPRNSAIDPDDELLWRFTPRRLSAEEIRDSMLAIGNTLEHGMPQRHPFPPEQEFKYTQHKPFVALYETNHRSVYLMQQRIRKQPFLATFDGADTNASTATRSISTTAIQALWMMNDPLVHKESDQFAVRVGLAFDETDKRIDYAYRLIYGRPATPEDISEARAYLGEGVEKLKEAGVPWDQQMRGALASLGRVMFASNEFLFVE